MKYLSLLFILVCSPVSAQIGGDKILHGGVAAGSAMLAGHLLHESGVSEDASILSALILVNAAGLLKEYFLDMNPDSRDIGANAIGSLAGVVGLSLTFEF